MGTTNAGSAGFLLPGCTTRLNPEQNGPVVPHPFDTLRRRFPSSKIKAWDADAG